MWSVIFKALPGAFILFTFIGSVNCSDDTPVQYLVPTHRIAMMPSEDGKSFLLRQLQMLGHRDENSLREAIRHQRQIKFKSSYSELPVALQKAEAKNRPKSFSFAKPIQVIPSNNAANTSLAAITNFPPSSEVYFPQNAKNSKEIAVAKHFGKSDALLPQTPFRLKTKSAKNILKFKKRGRLVKKKMVGRKLIKPLPPKPVKIEQNLITLTGSSTENFENTISIRPRISERETFSSSRVRSSSKNGKRTNVGGPNPTESFKNPYYVETPPHVISSYSFVPEESKVSHKSKSRKHHSEVPSPSKLKVSQAKNPAIKQSKQTKNRPRNEKARKSKARKVKVTKVQKIKKQKVPRHDPKAGKSISENWDHFLQAEQSKQTVAPKPVVVKSAYGAPRSNKENRFYEKKLRMQKKLQLRPRKLGKSKSLSSRNMALMQKLIQIKTGFPDLLQIPDTNFKCGDFSGGGYFADVETGCQVFHICFGDRRASFVCPTGTAFSQQLLVCDWQDKVQCGGNQVSDARFRKSAAAQQQQILDLYNYI